MVCAVSLLKQLTVDNHVDYRVSNKWSFIPTDRQCNSSKGEADDQDHSNDHW